MKLIVGLGNPGSRYVNTRHNAGFIVLELLADQLGIQLNRKKFDAYYGEAELFDQAVVLLKPQTFMNLSGKSLRQWLQFYQISPKDLVVIHDDIDMAAGTVKGKSGGGHGGNNGIRSIIEETGERDFFRIKLGVGKPEPTEMRFNKEDSITSWVLGAFSEQELVNLKSVMFKDTMIRLQEIFQQSQQKNPKGETRA